MTNDGPILRLVVRFTHGDVWDLHLSPADAREAYEHLKEALEAPDGTFESKYFELCGMQSSAFRKAETMLVKLDEVQAVALQG